MSKEYIEQVCIENVAKILYHLSRFKSMRASFAYRQSRHSWLAAGVPANLESAVLQETLRQLGIPFEVSRNMYRGRSYRSVIIVLDVPKLRGALENLEKSGTLYRVLRKAYRRVARRLFASA
jgi:hypothetical protein